MAGWEIPREPGSQAPTKSSGSHEMLAEIHAFLSQILQESIFCKMKQKVPVKQMLSCRKKRFSSAKILSQTDTFLKKKCLATERNFLPQ